MTRGRTFPSVNLRGHWERKWCCACNIWILFLRCFLRSIHEGSFPLMITLDPYTELTRDGKSRTCLRTPSAAIALWVRPCLSTARAAETCRGCPQKLVTANGPQMDTYLSSQMQTFNQLLSEECIEIDHRIHLYLLYI